MIKIKNELKAKVDKRSKIDLAKKLNGALKKALDPNRYKVMTKIIDGHIAMGIQDNSRKLGKGDLIDLMDKLNDQFSKYGFINNEDYEMDLKGNILAIDFNPFI